MKYLFVIFLFVVVTKFNMGVKGDCCYQTTLHYYIDDCDCSKIEGGYRISESIDSCCAIKVCNDGVYYGYSYCGHGSCNIFGCNCDGGCISAHGETPLKNFNDKNGHMIKRAREIRPF